MFFPAQKIPLFWWSIARIAGDDNPDSYQLSIDNYCLLIFIENLCAVWYNSFYLLRKGGEVCEKALGDAVYPAVFTADPCLFFR